MHRSNHFFFLLRVFQKTFLRFVILLFFVVYQLRTHETRTIVEHACFCRRAIVANTSSKILQNTSTIINVSTIAIAATIAMIEIEMQLYARTIVD